MSKFTQVQTQDLSVTFFNEAVGETYHSKSGALEEAREKHVLPSKIVEKSKEGPVVIGDVCFGLGYNTIVALAKIWEFDPDANVCVYAFENDLDIIKQLQHVSLSSDLENARLHILELIDQTPVIKENYAIYSLQAGPLTMHLYLGDARECVSFVEDNSFDVVFFDPFSLKKSPEMWSKEFFDIVFLKMKKGSVLTTYSCAKQVRKNMQEAQFLVEDGPVVGRRSPATLAYKK